MCAVSAVEVDDDVAVFFLDDSAVVPADRVVVEDDVIIVEGADFDDALVKEQFLLVLRAGMQDQPGAPDVDGFGIAVDIGNFCRLRFI